MTLLHGTGQTKVVRSAMVAAACLLACGNDVPAGLPGLPGTGGGTTTGTGYGAAPTGSTGTSAGGTGGMGEASTSSDGGSMGGGGGAVPIANVTVFTYDRTFAPHPGMMVVVNDASGAVVATATTDAGGLAQVGVPLGGLVAMYPPEKGHNRWMQAVVDPPDGSTVHFHSFADYPPPQDETKYDVTMTGYPAASATLEVRTCFTMAKAAAEPGGTTKVLADDDNCHPSDKNTVLVIAYDAADKPIAWGRSEVTANPNNVVPVTVAVTESSFIDVVTTVAPIPEGSTVSQLLASYGDHPPAVISQEQATPNGTFTSSLTLPDTLLALSSFHSVSLPSGKFSRQAFYSSIPKGISFDPTVLAAVVVNPDSSDMVHPKVSWSLDPGAIGDAVSVLLTPGGSWPVFHVYQSAGGQQEFRLPDIPASVPHFKLDGPDGPPSKWNMGVTNVDDEDAMSWAAFSRVFAPPSMFPPVLVAMSGD